MIKHLVIIMILLIGFVGVVSGMGYNPLVETAQNKLVNSVKANYGKYAYENLSVSSLDLNNDGRINIIDVVLVKASVGVGNSSYLILEQAVNKIVNSVKGCYGMKSNDTINVGYLDLDNSGRINIVDVVLIKAIIIPSKKAEVTAK